jgi:hypothetical protein
MPETIKLINDQLLPHFGSEDAVDLAGEKLS